MSSTSKHPFLTLALKLAHLGHVMKKKIIFRRKMKELIQILIPSMIQELALSLKFEEVEILKFSQAPHSTINCMPLTRVNSFTDSFILERKMKWARLLCSLHQRFKTMQYRATALGKLKVQVGDEVSCKHEEH